MTILLRLFKLIKVLRKNVNYKKMFFPHYYVDLYNVPFPSPYCGGGVCVLQGFEGLLVLGERPDKKNLQVSQEDRGNSWPCLGLRQLEKTL